MTSLWLFDRKNKQKTNHQLATGTEDDYILKVTGYKEYLIGSHKILSYDYIRSVLPSRLLLFFVLLLLLTMACFSSEYIQEVLGEEGDASAVSGATQGSGPHDPGTRGRLGCRHGKSQPANRLKKKAKHKRSS